MARLARILPIFFVTYCSASPDAGILKGIEKVSFENEGDGQPEILRKIGETSEETKPNSKSPNDSTPQKPSTTSGEVASASSAANQDKSPQTPLSPQPVAPPPNQLPEVKIESDKALLPIASAISQQILGVSLPGEEEPIVDLYSFVGGSSDVNYSLSCSTMRLKRDSNDKPSTIVCTLVDSSLVRLSVEPSEVVWSVSVTKCPKVTITGNVMTPGCLPSGAVSQCPDIVPAARVNLRDVNLAQCVENRSQLIFTIKNLATDALATMTMTLTKTVDQGSP